MAEKKSPMPRSGWCEFPAVNVLEGLDSHEYCATLDGDCQCSCHREENKLATK